MYSQNFKKETPTVITYHNKQAINDLVKLGATSENNIKAPITNTDTKKSEKDENLLLLILTLLLSHDIESSGIEYLIVAITLLL